MAEGTIQVIDYTDISNLFNIVWQRMTIDKMSAKKYNTGRYELYVRATITTNLTSAQRSLLALSSSTHLPATATVTGTANVNGSSNFFVCSDSAQTNIDVYHNGLSTGDKIVIYITWYV